MSSAGGPRRKVIFIVIDALRDDAAQRNLGFFEGLVERGQAARYHARCVLPSVSRTCYEALMTGTYPHENGIVCNEIVRRSTMRSLFDIVYDAGGTNAVIGWYFFSELYCEAPYDPALHCERDAEGATVAHGRFYQDGNFPDSHAICQAEYLRERYAPDLLVLHLNYPDSAGHSAGSDSREYATAILTADEWISRYYRTWLDAGYTLFITGDHGTNARGYHGGADDELRAVPLYIAGSTVFASGRFDATLEQPVLASLICREMGLQPSQTMHLFGEEVSMAI